MYGEIRGVVVGKEHNQITGDDILPEDETRPVGDASAGQRGRQQHLHIIRRQMKWSINHMRQIFRIGKDPISGRNGFAKRQTRGAPKLFGIIGGTMARQEGRRGA